MFFHVPLSSLYSVVYTVYKSFTSLELIPKYFILFDAIVNEILFSISVLTCSLLEYKNKTDFV